MTDKQLLAATFAAAFLAGSFTISTVGLWFLDSRPPLASMIWCHVWSVLAIIVTIGLWREVAIKWN